MLPQLEERTTLRRTAWRRHQRRRWIARRRQRLHGWALCCIEHDGMLSKFNAPWSRINPHHKRKQYRVNGVSPRSWWDKSDRDPCGYTRGRLKRDLWNQMRDWELV